MRPPKGKGIKRQKKREVIDRRRLMHALISAAILHLLFFTVVELFIDLPGVSSSSIRKPAGTEVRIQFPSPKASEHESSRSSERLPRQDPGESPAPAPEPAPAPDPGRASAESENKSSRAAIEKPADPAPEVVKNSEATELPKIAEVSKLPEVAKTAEAAEVSRDIASGAEETANDSAPDVEETVQTKTFTQPTFSRASQHLSSSSLPPVSSFPSSSTRSAGDRAEKMEVEKQDFTVYLKELLGKYHRYPLAARRRNIEGEAEFSVYVSKDGSLESLEILRSSGSGILDKAAQDLLEDVFPVDYPLTGTVSTTVRINYRLQDV